jgi:hypothetical protein
VENNQMRKYRFINFILLGVFLLVSYSCQQRVITDKKEYFNYLSDPKNGLIKEKETSDIKIKVKYLSSDFLAFNQLRESKKVSTDLKDSIRKTFDNSITFILNIGPSDELYGDITRLGLENYKEFAERIEEMAFNAGEWIRLTVNEKEYRPVLTKLESINAIENSRNFIVVFSSEKNTKKDLRNYDLCFTYTDDLFHTGTNKFIFRTEDIEKVPSFNF